MLRISIRTRLYLCRICICAFKQLVSFPLLVVVVQIYCMSVMIRADVAPVDVVHLAKKEYGLTITDVKELPGFEDRNFLVTCEPPPPNRDDKEAAPDAQQRTSEQYVIKISGSRARDKNDDSKLEKQRLIMNFLSCEKFICPQVVKTNSGSWFEWYDRDNGPMRVRMQTYVPGDTLMDHWGGLSVRDTLTTLGEFVSKLHLALERLTQSGDIQVDIDTQHPWRMDNFLCLKDFLHEIQDVTKRQMLSDILQRFQEEVLCELDSLSAGIVHGDIHDMNIIINAQDGSLRPIHQPARETDPECVKNTFGIIDFGDVTFSKYVFEVSMVIRDAIVDVKSMDPIEIAGHFLAGYVKHRPLNCAELDVLFVCCWLLFVSTEFWENTNISFNLTTSTRSWVLKTLGNIWKFFRRWTNLK